MKTATKKKTARTVWIKDGVKVTPPTTKFLDWRHVKCADGCVMVHEIHRHRGYRLTFSNKTVKEVVREHTVN